MKKLLFALLIFVGCAGNLQQRQYVETHPDLSESMKQRILEKKISIGMTQSQVRASWGDPARQSKSIYEGATINQWVYGYPRTIIATGQVYFVPTTWLYFQDGVLKNIQKNE